MGLFDRNWAGEALSKAASALAGFRYSSDEPTEEEVAEKEQAKKEAEEERLKAKKERIQARSDRNFERSSRRTERDVGDLMAYEDGGMISQEVPEDKLTELAHKIYADDAVMFGRDRKIANDWAAQISDETFIEGMVSVEAGEQEYIQLVEMLVQFIEMSKKYFRENYGTPEDEVQKGTFMSAYKRSKSGKNIYEQQGLKDVRPWSMYEQMLMKLESSDVSFRIESGIPTITSRGVIRPLSEDNRSTQPFMPQLIQIQQPESKMQ